MCGSWKPAILLAMCQEDADSMVDLVQRLILVYFDGTITALWHKATVLEWWTGNLRPKAVDVVIVQPKWLKWVEFPRFLVSRKIIMIV